MTNAPNQQLDSSPIGDGDLAVIRIANGLAGIDMAFGEHLRQMLSYTQAVFSADGNSGFQHNQRLRELFVERDGLLVFPAGLAARATDHLMRLGFQVQLDDRRGDRRELRRNERTYAELSAVDQHFLDVVEAQRLGHVAVHSETDRSRLITLIGRHYSWANLLMVVMTKREISDLHDAIAPQLAYQIATATGSRDPDHWRVICTSKAAPAQSQSKWDIVIFPYAEHLSAVSFRDEARKQSYARVFGFVSAHWHPDRRDRLFLEAWSGPEIYRVADPRGEPAAVRVVFVEAPWIRPQRALAPLARKRHYRWGNAKRNGLIAEVAHGLLAGDQSRLWQVGGELGEAAQQFLAQPAVLRLAVVVESVEHGKQLQRLLPEFAFARALPGGAEQDELSTPCIVTLVQLNKISHVPFDVIVWTVGDEEGMDHPKFPPRQQFDKRHPILLVDFADAADDRAAKETKRRWQDYLQRGWQVEGPPAYAPNRGHDVQQDTDVLVVSNPNAHDRSR